MDVIALGEVLIDFTMQGADKDGYPLMQANPGGAPCNFLAALSKYGVSTGFIGKVGNDAFGNMLKDTLEGINVDTTGLVMSDDVFTTLAFVTIDDKGERSFSFARKPGADESLTVNECRFDLIDSAKVFHFGTLSLTGYPAREATEKAVEYARSKGKLISFDPNLRLPLWDDPLKAKEAFAWGLSMADVVKISDEEVKFLWDVSPKEGARLILDKYNASLVFVTMGKDGAYFENTNAFGFVSAPKVTAIDTTGAGDIFGGSALSRILKLEKHPDELTKEELIYITEFAVMAASLSTQKSGGMKSVPDIEEVTNKQ